MNRVRTSDSRGFFAGFPPIEATAKDADEPEVSP
jgi:hypothetical protein